MNIFRFLLTNVDVVVDVGFVSTGCVLVQTHVWMPCWKPLSDSRRILIGSLHTLGNGNRFLRLHLWYFVYVALSPLFVFVVNSD